MSVSTLSYCWASRVGLAKHDAVSRYAELEVRLGDEEVLQGGEEIHEEVHLLVACLRLNF